MSEELIAIRIQQSQHDTKSIDVGNSPPIFVYIKGVHSFSNKYFIYLYIFFILGGTALI